ncbi:hypothetical protein Ahy_Scaffold5g107804 [Arachis hypogaea]|uniref:FAR1 domain-containing protein n=1 Tax=Arachis hypogaea TaxID=3818 RepID=A0A444WQ79_ARAHY|nr:hypothetical protein Ahy_Scaffold5g107804 [Arachis hypogaea]
MWQQHQRRRTSRAVALFRSKFLKSSYEIRFEQIMNDSSSNCQLNQSKVDYCFESNQVAKFWCNLDSNMVYYGMISVYFQFLCDVDEQLVPKVGMTFNTLEEAEKFYKDYSKLAGFSTKIRNKNKKENEIKNQLITYTREGK